MLDNHDHDNDNHIEESVIAKSTGQQEEEDVAVKDAALYSVLNSKKKMSKPDAGYREQEKDEMDTNNYNKNDNMALPFVLLPPQCFRPSRNSSC
jgi:hypothetical protein